MGWGTNNDYLLSTCFLCWWFCGYSCHLWHCHQTFKWWKKEMSKAFEHGTCSASFCGVFDSSQFYTATSLSHCNKTDMHRKNIAAEKYNSLHAWPPKTIHFHIQHEKLVSLMTRWATKCPWCMITLVYNWKHYVYCSTPRNKSDRLHSAPIAIWNCEIGSSRQW